jgi:pSer/pThr/pTyr-binding forkhead associated (FHA) protein
VVLSMLAILIAARPASGAMQLSIGNPSLDHFKTDGGVQIDFGLTDNNGAPVGNLRVDNVEVYEDGKRAKILDFRGQGQGRPVDIVFILDVTESMQPYVDAVKQNVISFAEDLARNNRDYRLGLVTFEDYVVSKEPDCGCAYRNKMTSNVQEFTQWVGSLHAGGGGDIPEDQLDALAYASTFPFRPEAQGIIILVTDAPDHHAGDGSAHTQHDQGFWDHHPNKDADVTDLTADKVAAMLKKNGLTLYAVVPPPFIAPDYAELVSTTHGRSYNIVTEEGRFSELVREIGHSIATEYSLTYRTPVPIEDGTERKVELKINYNGDSAATNTEYQVPGIGGARINIPEEGEAGATANEEGTGLTQLSFQWWNGAVPLIAILALLALSRAGLGPPAEELKAILAASNQPAPRIMSPPRPTDATAARPAPPRPAAAASAQAAAARVGTGQAKLITVNPVAPVAAEYSLLKDEISLGRGTENDLVIPHASVSRVHARIQRRNALYQLVDLNSTNGTFLNDQPVHGAVPIDPGSEVRLGEVSFIFRA